MQTLKKILLLLIILSLNKYNFYAQTCNCPIAVIKKTVEKDYPAFELLKQNKSYKDYFSFTDSILKQKSKTLFNCEQLILHYILQFRDGHFSFYSNNSVDSLYLNRNVKVTKNDNLIGYWKHSKSDFFVQIDIINGVLTGVNIQKGKQNMQRDTFAYFVPSAKKYEYYMITKFDELSHKIELVNLNKNNFILRKDKKLYNRIDFIPKFNNKVNVVYETFYFKELSKNTNYINIPNLEAGSNLKIDSLLKKYEIIIKQKNNLIIDLRNNGGGNTNFLDGLLPYIVDKNEFTNLSGYSKGTDTLISYFENYCNSVSLDKSISSRYYCDTFLPLLKSNYNKLFMDTSKKIYLKKMIYPKNVFFLMNESTASAAEMGIYNFRKSKKVKVIGENSLGAMDTGSPFEYNFNCNIVVSIPSEVCEFVKEKKYDFTGMIPDVYFDFNKKNWQMCLLKIIE